MGLHSDDVWRKDYWTAREWSRLAFGVQAILPTHMNGVGHRYSARLLFHVCKACLCSIYFLALDK